MAYKHRKALCWVSGGMSGDWASATDFRWRVRVQEIPDQVRIPERGRLPLRCAMPNSMDGRPSEHGMVQKWDRQTATL